MWEICANQLLPKALKSGPKSKKITQSGHTAKVEYPGDQSYSRGALCVVVLIDFIITHKIFKEIQWSVCPYKIQVILNIPICTKKLKLLSNLDVISTTHFNILTIY